MEIFILTLHTEQAIQKYKIQKTCVPTRESNNKDMQPRPIEDQIILTLNQKALTEIIQVAIK